MATSAGVFTAIRPRKLPVYDVEQFRRALEDGLADTAQQVIADYGKTVSTWEHKPEFSVLGSTGFRIGRTVMEITVGTEDEIYGYVDLGTKKHLIRPRRARVLAFGVGGSPKTRPNRLLAQTGSAGTIRAFAQVVHHPGTKARNFSKMIQKKHQQRNTLGKAIQSRIDKLAEAAGR